MGNVQSSVVMHNQHAVYVSLKQVCLLHKYRVISIIDVIFLLICVEYLFVVLIAHENIVLVERLVISKNFSQNFQTKVLFIMMNENGQFLKVQSYSFFILMVLFGLIIPIEKYLLLLLLLQICNFIFGYCFPCALLIMLFASAFT